MCCHSIGCGSGEPNAVANAAHDALICVYDAAGKVIETHKHTGDFKEW